MIFSHGLLLPLNVIQMVGASTLSSFASDFAIWSIVMYVIAIIFISLCLPAISILCFEMPFTRLEKLMVGRLLGTLRGSLDPDCLKSLSCSHIIGSKIFLVFLRAFSDQC